MKPILVGILFVLAAFGQSSPQGFDVVSIKPSDPSAQMVHIGISQSGSFEAKGVDLKTLLMMAYDVRGFQISGGPGWAGTDRYDIVTKDMAGSPSEEALKTMNDAQRNEFRDRLMGKVRLLMADRFQLKIHRESKELTVYALVVAKGGSKLEAVTDDDIHDGGLNAGRAADGKTAIVGKNLQMENLVRYLAGQVGRDVLDKTGLTGKYNFKFSFSPDLNRPPDIAAPDAPRADTSGPSIFTALQEQLGLRLDTQKAPVEIIVIDSVQKPSDN
jgi:uncharacterized protein (TIGR03435 family)